MAYEIGGFEVGTLVAAADLSTKQHFFVKVDSNGKVALAGANELAIGVLQNDPKTDEAATVRVHGITKVVAGAAISKGDRVGSDANGKARGGVIVGLTLGIALEAASADLDVIAVLLTNPGTP